MTSLLGIRGQVGEGDGKEGLGAVRWTPYLHEVAELLDVDPDLLAVRVELMSDEERALLNERLGEKETRE